MTNFTFDSRETYLEYVVNWKKQYAEISAKQAAL